MQFKAIEKLALVVAPLALSLLVTGFLVQQTIRSDKLEAELEAARLRVKYEQSGAELMARIALWEAKNPTYTNSGVSLVASADKRILLSVPVDALAQFPRLQPPSDVEQSLAYLQMRDLGATIHTLPDGKVTLNAPSQMTVGDVREVSALVGVGVAKEKLEEVFRQGDQHFSGDAKISHKMRARLTGANFKIEGVTTEEQVVALGLPTMWKWKVDAALEGTQTLTAMLYAVVASGKDEVEIMVDSYDQNITVDVKPLTLRSAWESAKTAFEEATAMWIAVTTFLAAVLSYTGRKFGKFMRWIRSKADSNSSSNIAG